MHHCFPRTTVVRVVPPVFGSWLEVGALVRARTSNLGRRKSGPRARNLVQVSAEPGLPAAAPSLTAPSLTALRQSQARSAALRRRMLPVTALLIAFVDVSSARAGPGLGVHGTQLVLALGLAGFTIGVLGVRGALLAGHAPVRVYGPLLGLLVLSSVVLEWVQPAGPGVGGCAIAAAVAFSAGLIAARLAIVLFLADIAVWAVLVTGAAGPRTHRQLWSGAAVTIVPFAGFALLALVLWLFRVRELQSARLLRLVAETRDAELRAASLAERQRLARDMHDVLAHSLSGLVLHLEGARLLAAAQPDGERIATALDRAHQLARSGLDEARQAIGMLRGDELPGPGRLAALTSAFETDTGIRCQFSASGEPRELGSAVKLALYRVTQEALTNVRKHARPDLVTVRLDYERSDVSLSVEDFADGHRAEPVPVADSGGYGLTGMRERAEVLGGTLTARGTGRGFLVALRVPA